MPLIRRTRGSDIDAVAARQLVARKEATLLDVREDDEWEASLEHACFYTLAVRSGLLDASARGTLCVGQRV
jgi:rhodanese-related sulfurtransferase